MRWNKKEIIGINANKLDKLIGKYNVIKNITLKKVLEKQLIEEVYFL